jgi:hypothetical protein
MSDFNAYDEVERENLHDWFDDREMEPSDRELINEDEVAMGVTFDEMQGYYEDPSIGQDIPF